MLAKNPPCIVVHGSAGSCLLFGRAKFWSWSRRSPGPPDFLRHENLDRKASRGHGWPGLSAASRRGPSTGSVAQGQDRRASDESLDDNLGLPLALPSCVVWSVVDRQTNKMKGTHEAKFLQFICLHVGLICVAFSTLIMPKCDHLPH